MPYISVNTHSLKIDLSAHSFSEFYSSLKTECCFCIFSESIHWK